MGMFYHSSWSCTTVQKNGLNSLRGRRKDEWKHDSPGYWLGSFFGSRRRYAPVIPSVLCFGLCLFHIMSSFFQLNWCILVFWTRNYSLVPTYCACSRCSACAVILFCVCQWRKLRFLIYFHLYRMGCIRLIQLQWKLLFWSSSPPAPPSLFHSVIFY